MRQVHRAKLGILQTMLLACLPVSPVYAGQDFSEIIRSKSAADAPVWVAAEAATTADGHVDWELLGGGAREIYESVVRNTLRLMVDEPGSAPKHDLDSSGLLPECVHYGAAHFDYPNPPMQATLEDVLRNALAVMRGSISAITPGFYQGEPNSLLTVAVERRIRTAPAFPESSTFYVVYPKARFGVGDTQFCKQDSKFPYVPKIGDRVLLLPLYGPQGEGGRLIQPGAVELIIEKSEGGLILPRKFGSSIATKELTSLEDIEGKLTGSN